MSIVSEEPLAPPVDDDMLSIYDDLSKDWPVSRVDKTEIFGAWQFAKWPGRCSAAEGTAACGARGRPPGLA